MTQFPAVDYAFSIKSTVHDIYKITQNIQKLKSVQPYLYTARKTKMNKLIGENKNVQLDDKLSLKKQCM